MSAYSSSTPSTRSSGSSGPQIPYNPAEFENSPSSKSSSSRSSSSNRDIESRSLKYGPALSGLGVSSSANISSRTRHGTSSLFRTSTKMSASELENYDTVRCSLYPKTYDDKHPSAAARRDYNRYSKETEMANRSTKNYFTALSRENRNAEDRSIGNLDSDQHRKLLRPSARAATHTARQVLATFSSWHSLTGSSQAQARERFLVTHPYAYKTSRTRTDHEDLADSAFAEARHHRQRYDAHLERSR